MVSMKRFLDVRKHLSMLKGKLYESQPVLLMVTTHPKCSLSLPRAWGNEYWLCGSPLCCFRPLPRCCCLSWLSHFTPDSAWPRTLVSLMQAFFPVVFEDAVCPIPTLVLQLNLWNSLRMICTDTQTHTPSPPPFPPVPTVCSSCTLLSHQSLFMELFPDPTRGWCGRAMESLKRGDRGDPMKRC